MHTRLKLAAFFLVVGLFSLTHVGCGGGGSGLSGEFPDVKYAGSLSGYLVTPSSSSRVLSQTVTYVPLVEATVTCAGRQDITDSAGYFRVNYLPTGTIVCKVTKAGYNTVTFSAVIALGSTTVLSTPVTVALNGTYIVTASVSPTSGTTSDTFTLTCTVEGGTPSKIEGRCDSSDDYVTMSSTTKSCTYTAEGSYTPGCRADGTYSDDVDSSVTVTEATSLTVTASVSPTSGTTADTYVLTCTVSGGTATTLEGRCHTSDSYATISSGITKNCTYTSAGSYTPGCRVDSSGTDDVNSAVSVSAVSTSITVSSFSPANGATGVTYDGTTFSVIFSGSLSTSVDLNNQTTLTASGFSITIQNNGSGNTLVINTTNALSYGSFAYTTTSSSNDTLSFTLKSTATLRGSGLKALEQGVTYNITAFTAPSNLAGASGETVDTSTGVPTTGSFTTGSDTTAPQVSSFSPASGATGVAYDSTVFSVVFNESMDSSIDLNTPAVITASGFSVALEKQGTGGTLTIDSSNALSYGYFNWTTTSVSNDTLTYTLYSNATLSSSGLKTLVTGTTYNITSRTVPTNLKDVAGNSLDTATNIPSTGSFTTQ